MERQLGRDQRLLIRPHDRRAAPVNYAVGLHGCHRHTPPFAKLH
jgi:hypothetical protein